MTTAYHFAASHTRDGAVSVAEAGAIAHKGRWQANPVCGAVAPLPTIGVAA